MNCDKSNLYMMKYIDGDITEEEAKRLNEHILCCEKCKKDFEIYDNILKDFAFIPEFEAPEGFENEVMQKISALNGIEIYTFKNKIMSIIWGLFTIIFGSGAMLLFYRESIIKSLSQTQYFAEKISNFLPISEKIEEQADLIIYIFNDMLIKINDVFANIIIVFLTIITVICAFQFISLHKRQRQHRIEDK